MNDQNHRQQAERLRALWKSGRDKYASFFSVLNEVRQDVGDEALPAWCFDELRIGISVIVEARRLLTAMDAEIVKADLAASKKAEAEQRKAEADAKRKAREEEEARREEEKRRRDLARAEHERQLAELAKGTAKKKRDAKAIEAGEEAPKNEGLTTRQIAQRDARNIDRRARDKINSGMSEFEAQAQRYLEADRKANGAREQWIAATLVKAEAMHEMRALCPADRDFGATLTEKGITVSADDRAALLGLARLGREKMRELLTSTERSSVQHIWRETKPQLTAVK